MDSHHRKIDLQSPLDLPYLHSNTLSLSHQKLNLHFPPSASTNNGSEPDPMRERVRELVDDFITKTFHTASSSITVNGLDAPSPLLSATSTDPTTAGIGAGAGTDEAVEYEPYDTRLAARVTSLYAQLEALTTTVAQLRRDAPSKAVGGYVDLLRRTIEEEDEGVDESVDVLGEEDVRGEDIEMGGSGSDRDPDRRKHQKQRGKSPRPDWKLDIPLGTTNEASRWRDGDMAAVYEDALRSLLRLQGESAGDEVDDDSSADQDGRALASTVGKAERAGKAADVVENM